MSEEMSLRKLQDAAEQVLRAAVTEAGRNGDYLRPVDAGTVQILRELLAAAAECPARGSEIRYRIQYKAENGNWRRWDDLPEDVVDPKTELLAVRLTRPGVELRVEEKITVRRALDW